MSLIKPSHPAESNPASWPADRSEGNRRQTHRFDEVMSRALSGFANGIRTGGAKANESLSSRDDEPTETAKAREKRRQQTTQNNAERGMPKAELESQNSVSSEPIAETAEAQSHSFCRIEREADAELPTLNAVDSSFQSPPSSSAKLVELSAATQSNTAAQSETGRQNAAAGNLNSSNRSPTSATIVEADFGNSELTESVDPDVDQPAEGDLSSTLTPVGEAGNQRVAPGNSNIGLRPTNPATIVGALDDAAVESQPTDAAEEAATKLPQVIVATDATSARNANDLEALNLKPEETGDKADGTSVAKLLSPMRKGIKANEIAQAEEQNLPVASVEAGREIARRTEARPARLAAHSDWNPHLTFAPHSEIPRLDAGTVSFVLPASAAAAPNLSLERTQELVTAHALRLKHSEDGSLQVVIKPGDGLQLSLDLRRVAGGVEVRAELTEGDFSFLSRHWSELQQQLESRGIRLGDLTSGPAANGEWSQREQEAADVFPEAALPQRRNQLSTAGPVRLAGNRSGWEFWA